ncbi:MAG: zinc ribbon domain-containing protein [Atopobiaceae bacterium]|nr:zinc ribbon domain-containing protein [Atopobiaceae bacterium]
MADEDKKKKRSLSDWMSGRNGADALGICVFVVAVILIIINVFVRTFILSGFSLLLMIYVCWRMASRDVEAREVENVVFLDFVSPIVPWFRHPGTAAKELKEYKHLQCPDCGQRVRVPRKKGKLRVTCPKCGTKFEAKS